MHSLLEAYLEQVAAHLSALPAERRGEELREMRQHLQNAVTVNQELGQSEEEAAANAVMQFGTPEDLGGNLVWAWRRERTLNRRSLFGAIACTSGLMFTLPAAVATLLLPIYSLTGVFHGTSQWSWMTLYVLGILAYDLPAYVLIGMVSGCLFPTRAALGTGLVLGGWTVFVNAHRLCWGQLVYWPGKLRYAYFTGPFPSSAEDILRLVVPAAMLALIAVASASVTSRWWMKQTARKRLAQS